MSDLHTRILKVAEVLDTARTAKFVNLLTSTEKQKYAEECWALLQEAYKSIGGFQSATSPEALINDSFMWKLKWGHRSTSCVQVTVWKKSHSIRNKRYI